MVMENRYNIGGDPIFDWNINLEKYKEYHKKVIDDACRDIHSLPLTLDDVAEINASMMMMFKECRHLYKQQFLDEDDFIKVFQKMELSVSILLVVLEELEFGVAIQTYNTFIQTLGRLNRRALKLELYEIAQNILLFREFFIDQTFDFQLKTFKK